VNTILDLGKISQYRTQVIDITIAVGSAIGNYSSSIYLDQQFNKILGIGFVEIAAGGLANQYNVGAKTDRQQWLGPNNTLFWTANGNVGPMMKYYQVNIPYVAGDPFFLQINTQAAVAGADFKGQMTLFLAKDLTELPRT
jgi:hypothetical protein